MQEAWEQSDLRHLQAAEGWLDLGLPGDGRLELGQVSAARQEHPLTLTLRWRICAATRNWEEAVAVGELLVRHAPDDSFGWVHRSYALHELKRTVEAESLLTPALVKFPDEELVAYNLACYACQLGRKEDALTLLRTAMARGNAREIRKRALEDSDLAPLRDQIAVIPVSGK